MTGPREGAPRTKPYVLRPQARKDRRSEVHHYRQEAGAAVANKLVKAMAKALQDLARNPSIGSPAPPLPLCVDIDGLVGVNYLGRRVASRRNVTRQVVVVFRVRF